MSEAFGPTYDLAYRRRREGRTNYARRLALIKSGKTRLVVRKTNKHVILQFVDAFPEGDKTLSMTVSSELKKFDFPAKRNAASAYLTGLLAGKKAKAKNVKEFILDIGMNTSSNGSIVFAAAKGVLDAGIESSYKGDKFPEGKLSSLEGDAKKQFENAKDKILKG